ncbi:MAG: MBL fold metallo-hydrolase [Candidatus Lokiarchaeota archaeon]|nr:MBL fold metallo-hydrolase [Candidatus Lokiarchaeota archaeon]
MMKLTLLVDDFVEAEPGFQTGYGFSMLIELNEKKVLFDTATHPDDLSYNLNQINMSGNNIDAIFLSHNHNDHTNGLPAILKDNNDVDIYIHKDWNKRHTFKGMKIPKKNAKILDKGRQLKEIDKQIYASNSLHSFDYGSIYEHALWIRTEKNIILITGCCHPGLDDFINDLSNLEISIDRPLTIVGGFHGFKFKNARAEEVNKNLKNIYPCHCTSHFRKFKKQFGHKCETWGVGRSIEIR